MRIFLDECADWRLSRDLTNHEVKSARQMGWTTMKNGELLTRASAEFDVFLTTDRNLSYQQNLQARAIAVVVLIAASNRLAELQRLLPDLIAALPGAEPGKVTVIGKVPS